MPIRFKIIGLIMLGTIINYIDRVNISVAAPEIMSQTGWDEARFGMVFSAFLLGYALLQYPGGAAADRRSARRVVGLSCIGFSLFTALTPLGQNAFILLLFLRFLVGASESLSFPSFASLNARWIPRGEFARAQAMLLSGVYLGQVVAYPSTSWIVHHFSWQTVFYVNAGVGLLWVTLWFGYVTDSPQQHSAVGSEERKHIEAGLAPRVEGARASLWAILRCPAIVYLCLSYMLFGFIAWIFILWFPTYLVKERGLSLLEMGMIGMLPVGAGFLGVLSGGMLSDFLLRRGFGARTARVRVPGLSVVVAAPFLVAAVAVPSMWLSIACFVAFYFTFSMALPGYWALPLELNAKFVGSISGVMNTSGNAAGLFGPLTAGFIVSGTGQWALPFYLAAGLAVVCGVLYVLLVRTEPIEIEASAPR